MVTACALVADDHNLDSVCIPYCYLVFNASVKDDFDVSNELTGSGARW